MMPFHILRFVLLPDYKKRGDIEFLIIRVLGCRNCRDIMNKLGTLILVHVCNRSNFKRKLVIVRRHVNLINDFLMILVWRMKE